MRWILPQNCPQLDMACAKENHWNLNGESTSLTILQSKGGSIKPSGLRDDAILAPKVLVLQTCCTDCTTSLYFLPSLRFLSPAAHKQPPKAFWTQCIKLWAEAAISHTNADLSLHEALICLAAMVHLPSCRDLVYFRLLCSLHKHSFGKQLLG